MAAGKSRSSRRTKKKAPKRFRFQLGFGGVTGIGIVSFCLFLWMFLLGVWAGQTILLPSGSEDRQVNVSSQEEPDGSVLLIQPQGKKKTVHR